MPDNAQRAYTTLLRGGQPATTYLARTAGLRDVRELSRGLAPAQYKKASKAIAGIRVRPLLGPLWKA